MEARNRKLSDWHAKIAQGEIRLPRFQRFEAWDRDRICSLLQTVIGNLPLGITLILEVGDEEKFVSRYLKTAPEVGGRVHEHLLDGQQRLTALWRAFHNNYQSDTFFVYLQSFDSYDGDAAGEDEAVYSYSRYFKKNSEDRYPLWCDKPEECLRRGLIPTHLLRPEDIGTEIDQWVKDATQRLEPDEGKEELKQFYEFQKRVNDRIKDLRAIVANYNLPYLSLPTQTDKSVALRVFINMNTNSKPLSTYDIIVAEVEDVMGQSIHDLETALSEQHPEIGRYSSLSSLILTTSALLQGHLPNQRGAWDMDKRVMVENWKLMERGLSRMAGFLRGEGIYDEQRLPTNAVLAVIAALYADIPESGDQRGQDELLLKKYLWHAFFTNRYENSAATHAFSDFGALKSILRNMTKPDGSLFETGDVPIFADHALVEAEELMTVEWPKRASIRGRGILAVECRLGALDFSTGERLDETNIDHRHYHHVFPDALLKEAGINSFLALNCALICDTTNISLGRKDPLQYLKDRYQWTSETIVRERLQSHLIPIEELANGGYEGLTHSTKAQKLQLDFDAFIQKRSSLILKAVKCLAAGRQLTSAEIYSDGTLSHQ